MGLQLQFYGLASGGGFVCCEHDLMRDHRIFQSGKWHVDALFQGLKETAELCEVGMVSNISGIQHLHGQRAPCSFVRTEFHRMEFIIEQASLTSA